MTTLNEFLIDFESTFCPRSVRLRIEIVVLCFGLCAIAEMRNFCRSIRAMGRHPRHE
ncbi:MAG: hypothetical protein ABI771_02085 [Betaproteobacteria bacterium]